MPFRKIDEKDSKWKKLNLCRHPEHNPPGHIVLEDGTYEYECPACGKITIIHVNRPTLMAVG